MQVSYMPRFDKLLILDLDETLVFATESPLMRMPDFRAFDYYIYKRPGLDSFVSTCQEWFSVGIWTSSGDLYADRVVKHLFGDPRRLALVWSSLRCTRAYTYEDRVFQAYKDIKKLTRKGYRREKIIMVDDSPEKLGRNYGNGVIVRPYEGAVHDRELELLTEYLELLGSVENVRTVDKRGWRAFVLRGHDVASSAAECEGDQV